MDLSALLKKAAKDNGFSISALARRTNQTPQNLTMKIRRGSIDFEEFLKYCDIIGVKVNFSITYPDGSAPELPVQDARVRERLDILEDSLAVERRATAFLKGINTEVRTSLYSVSGYVDMALKQKRIQKDVRDCLIKAKAGCARLTGILDNAVAPVAPNVPDAPLPTSASLTGKRVMVVEDNEMNRDITRNLLEDNGLIVECVPNGAEAVNRIRESSAGCYDIILMDIQMPVMDGLEATRQIRAMEDEAKKNIPILAMTANAFEDDRKKSMEAGMDDHLTKPLNPARLMETMCRYM